MFRYASLHVGLIAVAVVWGTFALLGRPVSPALLLLAFCGSLAVYLLERLVYPAPEDALNQPARTAWAVRHRRAVGLLVALLVGMGGAVVPTLSRDTLGLLAVLLVVSGLYMTPLLPGGRRLKEIRFMKPVAIAAAWAAGGVLAPALESGAPFTAAVGGLVAYRFVMILANALMADWPDRAGDARAGLATVATSWPRHRLQRLVLLLLLLDLGIGAWALARLGVPHLLYVDLAGPVWLLAVTLGPWPATHEAFNAMIDLPVAWPAVTALCAAWGAG